MCLKARYNKNMTYNRNQINYCFQQTRWNSVHISVIILLRLLDFLITKNSKGHLQFCLSIFITIDISNFENNGAL